MTEKRGPWYLITGLVLGAIAGLLFSWLVQPVRYTNTSPSSLASEYKDQYRLLIASAYMANSDLIRAQARLALLKDADMYRAVAEQAQISMAKGDSPQDARALGVLAMALNQAINSAAQPVQPTTIVVSTSPPAADNGPVSATLPASDANFALNTPLSVTPTLITQTPNSFPTATLGSPFILKTRQLVCDEDFGAPLIQVIARDAADQPVSGIEIIINWEGGENHFFTGLKPELGLGYADFTMTPDVTYTLKLAEGGQSVSDLVATHCDNPSNPSQWGVWRLEFVQP